MNNREQLRVSVEFVEPPIIRSDEIGMVALVRVNCLLPARQNMRVVDVIEIMSDESGQHLKRELFRQGIEIADRELVLSLRAGKEGKGIQLFGTRRYTIKTRFGTVVVKRIRIRHKSDGSTEVPSARIWGTPRTVMISRGLKNAVCNTVIKESFGSTRKQIERQSGEVGIICKSTIGNILRQEGGALAAAQQGRAESVLKADREAKVLLGRAATHIAEPYFEDVYLTGGELESAQDAERLFDQIVWDPYQELIKQQECESIATVVPAPVIDEVLIGSTATDNKEAVPPIAREQIIAQVDEVVAAKQPGGKRDRVVHYNGSVKNGEQTFYCSGSTSAQLICQIGAILAQLGLHQGEKRLVVLSDCASWINNWVSGIGILEKEAHLCWWHLRDRCRELVGEAFTKKVDRDLVRRILLKYLWRGQTDKALRYLKEIITDIEDGQSCLSAKSVSEVTAIKNYLIKRQQYIPDYQARRKSKEWIASTQIEKFNHLSISARCKGNGQRWSRAGVRAVAALETARRNQELEYWQQQRELPVWRRAA